ncbi:hypothetical protein [Brevundimonas sp. NIBR11]|uniref:hypothetical protein n=1 Tax=Brevundimonas sp. NIBR11 TaxID=3015999 RepID=UPI0022F1118D|nr:hypothetical protein [Brevundimonas sp. NIBR11]WGM30216.1 hypothetical protein KKHFBJBL_00432 [Brevundimonas sp. NIBR11]
MTLRAKILGTALTGSLLLAAGATLAQTSGSAATRALNGAPAESTLSTRPNAQPPLTAAERPQATRARPSAPTRSQASSGDRALEDLLASTADDADAEDAEPAGVTLAAGETEPPPIPMTLGYYVRGEKECDQVWPGEGDLAWLTPTSFTIDFGGCEPGQFLQTGPNSWKEEQRCRTERGGDAGAYNVTYEVLGTDVIKRQARLGDDVDTAEDDLWNFCRLEDVPENARFGS